ncbi:CASP-like protein 2B1 [Raphanus sativus]|uniref:CASP-like protein n=1 Tax=Raphanus sativus TaxID=3726 RepID=A0A9W3D164_RAPSA|nr:CASP-like protein 2B1 [Raphanus sativus]KAJ4866498.1 CASP-like protein 2B1 [Raphanus sativus]
MSPGNVAVFHGGKMKLIDRRLKLTELLLRCSATLLALLALILIVTNTQVKQIFTIEKRAKYTDMKALVFLVVANGIAAAYSLLQSVRCVVGSMKGSVLLDKSLAWAIFLGDQAMAYISVAAIAASAESGLIGIRGEEKLQWMKLCNMFGKFCNRSAGGTATALLASVALVFVSCISAFSLFRLYGGGATQRHPNLSVTK